MLATKAQHQALIKAFRGGTPLTYKKGELIIRPGETPSGVFFIVEGIVKAFDITRYGEENLLIIRKANEIFPLIWALTGEGRYVIYEALSEVKVLRLDRQQFVDYLQKEPDALAPFLDIVLEMYKIHSERIINLEYRSVRERLVSFLLIMAARFGQKKNGGVTLSVPLRQQDIASSINASRETTGRELSALERKGLISTKQSIITIKNEKYLEELI